MLVISVLVIIIEWNLNSEVSESESFCISDPRGLKEKSFFSQETYSFQNLRNETFAIAGHKHVNIAKPSLLCLTVSYC